MPFYNTKQHNIIHYLPEVQVYQYYQSCCHPDAEILVLDNYYSKYSNHQKFYYHWAPTRPKKEKLFNGKLRHS